MRDEKKMEIAGESGFSAVELRRRRTFGGICRGPAEQRELVAECEDLPFQPDEPGCERVIQRVHELGVGELPFGTVLRTD